METKKDTKPKKRKTFNDGYNEGVKDTVSSLENNINKWFPKEKPKGYGFMMQKVKEFKENNRKK